MLENWRSWYSSKLIAYPIYYKVFTYNNWVFIKIIFSYKSFPGYDCCCWCNKHSLITFSTELPHSCLNIVLLTQPAAKIPSGQILFRSVLVSGNINYISPQQTTQSHHYFFVEFHPTNSFGFFIISENNKNNKKWLISENNKLFPDIKQKKIQNKWWKLFDVKNTYHEIFWKQWLNMIDKVVADLHI